MKVFTFGEERLRVREERFPYRSCNVCIFAVLWRSLGVGYVGEFKGPRVQAISVDERKVDCLKGYYVPVLPRVQIPSSRVRQLVKPLLPLVFYLCNCIYKCQLICIHTAILAGILGQREEQLEHEKKKSSARIFPAVRFRCGCRAVANDRSSLRMRKPIFLSFTRIQQPISVHKLPSNSISHANCSYVHGYVFTVRALFELCFLLMHVLRVYPVQGFSLPLSHSF